MNALALMLAAAAQTPPTSEVAFDRTSWVALTTLPPVVLALVGAVLIAAVVVSAFAMSHAPRRVRALLMTLRVLAAAALFILLLEPGLVRQATTKKPNTVVVAIDTSASMGETDGNSSSRFENAAKTLTALQQKLTGQGDQYRLRLVAFDQQARPLTAAEVTALAQTIPDGNASNLGAPIEVASAVRPAPLGGVVLLTDGADTADRARLDDNLKRNVAALEAPVHTVLFGDEQARLDLAVEDIDADEFAFVRNPFQLRARLRQTGLAGTRVPVTLFVDGEVMFTKTVLLTTEAEVSVEMSFEPKSAGQHILSVSVPAQPGERIIDNNRFDKTLKVIRDRVRVLQVAGRPSWDQRFVRRLLKENPSVDLISFFILRTPTDEARAANHELSLIPFPTRELFTEQLHTFDVVILQNFDYAPYHMGKYLGNIRDFVTDAGGGLLMIGGDLSFSEGDYAQTPVAEVLPVQLFPGRGHLDTDEFRPVLTTAGQTHPVTRLLELGFGENPYQALPPLEGVNKVMGLMPGAQTLLGHPYLNANDGAQPVIAVREVGNGRSMAVLTDTTWKWSLPHVGQGGRGDVHRRVFANALRWLIRDPDLSRVQVEPARDTFFEGESVSIDVRAVDAQYQPLSGADVSLTFRPLSALPNAAGARKLTGATQNDGTWRVQADDLPAGAYHVRAEGQVAGQSLGYASAAIVVRAGAIETRYARPERHIVSALAEWSGGQVVSPDDATSLNFVDRDQRTVHRQKTEPLWPHILTLLLLAGLFAAEWWLRRRQGFA